MIGIIHSIMLLVWACLGSAEGIMVIFCWAQVVAATIRGSTMGDGSGSARSIHQKWLLKGTMVAPTGFQEYSLWDSPTRWSGESPKVLMMAWYRPIHIGIWTKNGPRHPRGLTPASL